MRTVIYIVLLLLSVGTAYAQTDFETYRQQQQEAFNLNRAQNQERFDNYRDSLNRRYADFLEQGWKQFALQRPEPFIKNPITVPPVYDETEPEPVSEEIPTPLIIPIPEPVAPVEPEPIPIPPATINTAFFGTNIRLSNLSFATERLSGVPERAVAGYWRSLSKIPHKEIVADAMRITSELTLNDWGLYLLLGKIFETYAPHGSENEKVVFSVFMLNQMGYQAKIGRSGNDLIPLLAFVNNVTNCMYFTYGSLRYYTINPQHKNLNSIETCAIDYADRLSCMSLHITEMPKFTPMPVTKELVFANNTYTLSVNKNTIDFYKDYPCVEFSTYADAPLDPLALKSIEAEILPNIANKSQIEAVNWLLHFVQNAFEYKTDKGRGET